jgi:Mrp family chromosome partitioning ATPase
LILEAGSTRRRTTRTAVDRVRSSGIQILGAVLTKGEFSVPG